MEPSSSEGLGQAAEAPLSHSGCAGQNPPAGDSDNRTRGQLSEISPALNWLISEKRKGKNLGPDATS